MTRSRDVATQGGLVLLNTTTFSAVANFTIDNIFNSTYRNYKMLLDIDSHTASAQTTFVFRSAVPADLAANSSVAFMAYNTSTGVSSFGGGGGQLGFPLLSSGANQVNTFDLTICNPESTVRKQIVGLQAGSTSSFGGQNGIVSILSFNSVATSAAGFKIAIASGTMTGSIKIYGIRN